jgi:hypothetical protein
MTRRTIPKDEMQKLFHIRDDYDGGLIPQYPVYNPGYDGDQYRDWGDESDWYLWVVNDDKLERIRGFPEQSLYFGTEAESSEDIYFPFFSFFNQTALYPELMTPVERLLIDVRQISTSMSKIGLFDHLSRDGGLFSDQFVKSEIEYIFTTCRSMYESLQLVARHTWDNIELLDGGKQQLPRKFSDIALDGDNPVDIEYLTEERGLPEKLAEYYVDAAEDFARIRNARDDIIHSGKAVGTIYQTEDGLAVRSEEEFFAAFDVWEEENLIENDIAPLWPALAYVIQATMSALNGFVNTINECVKFPDPIAPDHAVFLRGDSIRYLPYLAYLIEVDPWGIYILEDVKQRYIRD